MQTQTFDYLWQVRGESALQGQLEKSSEVSETLGRLNQQQLTVACFRASVPLKNNICEIW